MSGITTHVLDTARGKPAAGIPVTLYRQGAGQEMKTNAKDGWEKMGGGQTDADGRLRDLLPEGTVVGKGVYKLRFGTKEYFAALPDGAGRSGGPVSQPAGTQMVASLYPYVEIVFEVTGDEHYHIPLLLSPFGYSTYRGS